jgi:hypothetical protein
MKLKFYRQVFENLKYQISSKSVQWGPSCSMRTDIWTDGQTWRSLYPLFAILQSRLKVQPSACTRFIHACLPHALLHCAVFCTVLAFSVLTVCRTTDVQYTRWFKYDRDYFCVNKSQFVPVIFEPPCVFSKERANSIFSMTDLGSFETSMSTYSPTRCQIPEYYHMTNSQVRAW